MRFLTRRLGLLTGAAVLAVGFGSVYISAQNNSGGPGPSVGRGGPGRFGGPGGPGFPGGPMGLLGPRMMERLNLSDAQREQVKSVLDSHKDEMKALGDKGFEARKALEAAVAADQFEETTIRARSADVGTVEADMAVLRARIHAEVWQILTPDQQTQAKTLQAQMEQRRQRGPGPGGAPARRRGTVTEESEVLGPRA